MLTAPHRDIDRRQAGDPRAERTPAGRPVVFYDGGCRLCQREIDYYRRLPGAEQLEWVDIAADRARLAAVGLGFETALQRFHGLDAEGRWQTGAYGFAMIWTQLPRYVPSH